MRRLPLRRIGLLLVAVAAGGEALVRLVETFGRTPTASLYSLIVPGKPRFTLRPNADIVVPERYGNIEYKLNSHGFRDREHSGTGPAQRVVLLGDSVTFGLGVRQEVTFAGLLAHDLETGTASRREVFNLAVFAYDTRDELATYRSEGAALEPAVVVLQFFLNDFAIEDHATTPRAPTWGKDSSPPATSSWPSL